MNELIEVHPSMRFRRAPCPRCGAETVIEADAKCIEKLNERCPAEWANQDGYLLQPHIPFA